MSVPKKGTIEGDVDADVKVERQLEVALGESFVSCVSPSLILHF